jgi:plasmid stabilization system protein ParE
MVRIVRWSRSALIDLSGILEFISNDAPLAAFRLAAKIRSASETLSTFPERGRIVPEFHDPTLREIFVSRFRILYEIQTEEVIIAAVIHMSRDLQKIFSVVEDA